MPTTPPEDLITDAEFGDADSRLARCLIETFTTTDAFIKAANSRRAHAIELPAGNGITNARSLSRLYAGASPGELVREISQHLLTFCGRTVPEDDVSIVAVRFKIQDSRFKIDSA